LNRQIAVSLENENVKVVYAEIRHGNISIEKTLTFSNTEFDHFLETTKDDEFIVVNDFQSIHQDVISVPPAQEKYLRTLIELEIKKRVPELKAFSFFYEELRDVQKEGKRSKDIFFFAIAGEDLDAILSRFSKHDKIITFLYPNVLPLSRFLRIEGGEEGQPILNVVDLGTNKTMFLMRDQKLNFVRVAQSEQRGISPLDIENINMTIAYCRQVLRLNPSRVVFSDSQDSGNAIIAPIVPVASVQYPSTVMAFKDTVTEYVIPIAALTYAKELRASSLLPPVYQGIHIQRKIMVCAIVIFLLLSALGIGYIGVKVTDTILRTGEIKRVRQDIAGRQSVIDEYEKVFNDLQKRMTLMNFMNTANMSLDMQKVLLSLQVFSMKTVNVKTINIKDEKGSFLLQVEGGISFRSYKELQSNYENVIDAIKKTNELEIVEQSLDLKTGNFRVDLKWKT
jgi:cell division protein FtsL